MTGCGLDGAGCAVAVPPGVAIKKGHPGSYLHVVKGKSLGRFARGNDHRRPHGGVVGALVQPDPTLQRRKIVGA